MAKALPKGSGPSASRTAASTTETLAASSIARPKPPRRSIKVVLIGDGGCGKTSLRNQFLSGTFSTSYRATIGADFITKSLPVDPAEPEGERVTLQIWDTAGQERFQSLGSAFYRGADAVIIAFDLTKARVDSSASTRSPASTSSLDRIKVWYDAFMDKAPGPRTEIDRKRFCWICVGNKSDLVQRDSLPEVDRQEVRAVLESLVPSPQDQPDRGLDPQSSDGHSGSPSGARPSGAKAPASPEEVLKRPDPNRRKQKSEADSHPNRTKHGFHNDRDRKLSEASRFETPYGSFSTITGLPSGLKVDRGDQTVHHKRGHQKRQSIRSIELFHPPHASDEAGRPSSNESAHMQRSRSTGGAGNGTGSSSVIQQAPTTPSKSKPAPADDRRQRVDSTLSVGAPSVYYTPRSSAFLGRSPSASSHLTAMGSRSIKVSTTSTDTRSSSKAVGANGGGQSTDSGSTSGETRPSDRSSSTARDFSAAMGKPGKLSTSPGPLSFLDNVSTLQSPPGMDRGRSTRVLPNSSATSASLVGQLASSNGSVPGRGRPIEDGKANGRLASPSPSSASSCPPTLLPASKSGKVSHVGSVKRTDIVPSATGTGMVPSGDPIPFPTGTETDEPLLSDDEAVEYASRTSQVVVDLAAGEGRGQDNLDDDEQRKRSQQGPNPTASPSRHASLPSTPRNAASNASITAILPPPLPSTAVDTHRRPGIAAREEGFTLFYTSAKTGQNVERMFRHVVDRVVARWVEEEMEVELTGGEQAGVVGGRWRGLVAPPGDREREEEAVRRGIRIADGKDPDPARGWRACCT